MMDFDHTFDLEKPKSYLFASILKPSFLFPFASIATFKQDLFLEKNSQFTAQKCLDLFIQRGGVFYSFSSFPKKNEPPIIIDLGDAIYPICPGGLCRSQTLWAIFAPFKNKIILFPPHAAIFGWDPYEKKLKTQCPCKWNVSNDQFSKCFKTEKPNPFAFEMFSLWSKEFKNTNDANTLAKLSNYFNEHYFGPHSAYHQKQGKRRIYVTFAQSTHVILHRLLQTNSTLKDVIVVHIDLEDIVASPKDPSKTLARSQKAYQNLAHVLGDLFDFSHL